MFTAKAAIAISVAALGGCAVPGPAREDARTLGLYVETIRRDAVELTDSRDALARARETILYQRDRDISEMQQDVEYRLYLWQHGSSAGGNRKTLYDAVKGGVELSAAQRQETAKLRAAAETRIASAKSQVGIRTEKLSEAAQGLMRLSVEPGFKDNAQFLVGFLRAVRDKTKELEEQGRAAAHAGAAKAQDTHQQSQAKPDVKQ